MGKIKNRLEWFGNDQEIPEHYKLVVTNDVMNKWLASHWGIGIDGVPNLKPDNMSRSIYNLLKKQKI